MSSFLSRLRQLLLITLVVTPALAVSPALAAASTLPLSAPLLMQVTTQDTVAPAVQGPVAPEPAPATGFMAAVDRAMGAVNGVISAVFFFDIMFWDEENTIPLVVAWLVIASIFFTIRMKFINFRAFKHAVNVTRGKYTDPNSPGEVSHFQALTSVIV